MISFEETQHTATRVPCGICGWDKYLCIQIDLVNTFICFLGSLKIVLLVLTLADEVNGIAVTCLAFHVFVTHCLEI